MKKLFCLLLTSLTCFADQVSFSWEPVPFVDGYRLYTTSGTFETLGTYSSSITVTLPPEARAYLVAFNFVGESDPTPSLLYHPLIIDVVMQTTSNLRDYYEIARWELFRIPDVLFSPDVLNVEQRMTITPERVGVVALEESFKIAISTIEERKKFFRSYVAVREP